MRQALDPSLPFQRANKLALVLCAATPERPETCVMPFVYAATAAAMEVEVEIHFTGRAVRLLAEGCAAALRPDVGGGKSLYEHMRAASGQGVRFFGCSMALEAYLGAGEPRIAEFAGAAGAATVIMRSLDPEWRVLSF
jgi:predicted peroxiredoxin